MTYTYPITPEQEKTLNRFTCERLSSNIENLRKIQNFRSYNGFGLVSNLLCNGWSADTEGSTAYYVIKNPKNQIVMFFSLKCGVLFDPDYAKEILSRFPEVQKDEALMKIWKRFMDGEPEATEYFLDKQKELGDDYHDFVKSLRIKIDKTTDPNRKLIRVDESHPAIELVEFCANDKTKRCWKDYGMGAHNKMGVTLFWKFIVPIMLQINSLIGCEYVYLFAADQTAVGKLTNYYREELHFENLLELGAIKPAYDLSCSFMGCRLRQSLAEQMAWEEIPRTDLEYYQKIFFDNFNIAEGDDIV